MLKLELKQIIFLLPAGGAMSLTKRYRVDIIRPVLLSNHMNWFAD